MASPSRRRSVARLLVVASLGVCAAGCGGSARLASDGDARFVHRPPPASGAPAIGPVHVVFLGSRHGVLATTGGFGYLAKVGFVGPVEPGRIQVTGDGGRSWRTVWERRDTAFRSLAFAGRVGIAQATLLDVAGWARRGHGGAPGGRPLALLTRDGGVTWRRLRAPAPVLRATLRPVTPGVWVALSRPLRRTDDAGRTWRTLPLPPGARPVAFATPSLGFAAAHGCLWRSADGGASWSRLRSTCGPPVSDLDVARDGSIFLAQGYDDEADAPLAAHTLVWRSLDGGWTWRTLLDAPDHPAVARLAFVDSRHGWIVRDSNNQGLEDQRVEVTIDGGRTWRTRRFPVLPVAFAGARAWAAAPLESGLWSTSDWGRTWTVSARPEQLLPSRLVAATRSELAVETIAGTLVSRDGGRRWRTRPALTPLDVARLEHRPAFLAVHDTDTAVAYATADGGRTWRPLAPQGFWPDTGDVAFLDARRGLIAAGQGEFGEGGRVPVYATADGGRTWRRVPVPRGVKRDREVTLGPGVVVIRRPPLLDVSTDDGRHWLAVRVRDDFWDCGASRDGRQLWILCSLSAGERGPSLLLRSDDAGGHWRRLRLPVELDPHLVATSPDEAWAIAADLGGGLPLPRNEGALWHTRDGGRTWHEVWPRLPAAARAYELR